MVFVPDFFLCIEYIRYNRIKVMNHTAKCNILAQFGKGIPNETPESMCGIKNIALVFEIYGFKQVDFLLLYSYIL